MICSSHAATTVTLKREPTRRDVSEPVSGGQIQIDHAVSLVAAQQLGGRRREHEHDDRSVEVRVRRQVHALRRPRPSQPIGRSGDERSRDHRRKHDEEPRQNLRARRAESERVRMPSLDGRASRERPSRKPLYR